MRLMLVIQGLDEDLERRKRPLSHEASNVALPQQALIAAV
jgi:hypothetical protein